MDLAEKQRKIAEINRKISNYKKLIVQAEENIDDLNKKLNEVSELRNKLVKLKKYIEAACDDSSIVLNGLKSMVLKTQAVIKDVFFAPFVDTITGNKFANAIIGVNSSINKTTRQINNLNDEIHTEKSNIEKYNHKIKALIKQKSNIESIQICEV